MNRVAVGGTSKGIINRNIDGHFFEHLGRCVYSGLYVGEDSPIPNRKGMRTDVVEAFKRIRIPAEGFRCALPRTAGRLRGLCPSAKRYVRTQRLPCGGSGNEATPCLPRRSPAMAR